MRAQSDPSPDRPLRTRAEIAGRRHDYNHVRPHSKLGGRTPAEKAGEPVRGHAPGQVVIHSTNHHEGAGLYL
ncbi:integrase core domain-containing protein [Novosphingobium indicum]|uniref:integrase core domain-containing protein n=1 Tax=Novosphingobium indicum TaxID=462949 RepID=UPI001668E261